MGNQSPRVAVKQAIGDVRKVLDGLNLAPDDLVLVACSGGADSLALAVVTQKASHRVGETTRKNGFNIRVGAVVIDHQLQHNSHEIAAQAAEHCRNFGLAPVQVLAVNVGSEGGLEAAGRSARYLALEQAATNLGAKAVLLGHTLDDQAEQVLLGLARGSGSRSLAGMPAKRSIFVRPFLKVRRSTTELICELHGLEPWHDPTNQQPVHLRNRIRLEVMPVLESAIGNGVPEALSRTAEQLREDADALDFYAGELLGQARVARVDSALCALTGLPQNDRGEAPDSGRLPNSGVGRRADNDLSVEHTRHSARTGTQSQNDISPPRHAAANLEKNGAQNLPAARLGLIVKDLLAAPMAVRRRALRLAAIEAGATASDMSRTQVLAIDALVANWHGQSAHTLPGNVIVRRNGEYLWFDKPQ